LAFGYSSATPPPQTPRSDPTEPAPPNDVKPDRLADGDQPFILLRFAVSGYFAFPDPRALFGDGANVQGFTASEKDFLKGAQ